MRQGELAIRGSWGCAIALCCVSVGVSAAAQAQVGGSGQAGIVKVVRGEVQVQRQAKGPEAAPTTAASVTPSVVQATTPSAASAALPVHVGDRLFPGDRVLTADGAAVGITLRDDTLVSLGPKSSFVLEQYNFNESSGDGNIAVRVVKGTLRYVTGLIGKHAPERQQVLTPTATIGIRGTDFIVDVASE